jgi:hypothetical protein
MDAANTKPTINHGTLTTNNPVTRLGHKATDPKIDSQTSELKPLRTVTQEHISKVSPRRLTIRLT